MGADDLDAIHWVVDVAGHNFYSQIAQPFNNLLVVFRVCSVVCDSGNDLTSVPHQAIGYTFDDFTWIIIYLGNFYNQYNLLAGWNTFIFSTE